MHTEGLITMKLFSDHCDCCGKKIADLETPREPGQTLECERCWDVRGQEEAALASMEGGW